MKIGLKRAFIFVLFSMVLVSCKKDYSCSCTNIDKDVGEGGETTITTENFTIEDATKDQARAACNEAKITYTYSDPDPNSSSVGTVERVCDLN